jgi:hypothetical protein
LLLLCSTLKLPRPWQAFAETPSTTRHSLSCQHLQGWYWWSQDCLLLTAFKCLPHSTAPGSWYGLLDTAAGGTDMWFGCNMLHFSMPTWPCLVAKLCGVAPKELAWDGLARNSKSIRQIERS